MSAPHTLAILGALCGGKAMPGDIPKTVKRYVEEHKEQGADEAKAWALAWSRYCKYKNPGSPRCKQDDYFAGRTAMRVAYKYLRRG